MSEEVATAAGDIAYWQQRAELAEADRAALRERLETTIEIAGVLLGDNDRYLNERALMADHPGAGLLAVAREALTIPRSGPLEEALNGLNRLFAVIDAYGLTKASGR